MKNIVLDTNCIMASISKKSDDYAIWRDFQLRKYNLCVTTEILEEYEEIISRTLTPEIARTVILYILNRPNVLRVNTYYKFSLITADYDDNKFVDCAIAANASYIVTNDSHFNELEKVGFPKVCHISIEDFRQFVLPMY